MKNLKKACFGAFVSLALVLGGVFTSCSDDDPEEDEDLVVSITGNQNIVTIAAPDDYNGKDVKIVYTDDGTEPKVQLNEDKTYVTTEATEYKNPFEISATKTIKARGYYYDSSSKTFYQGPVTTEEIKFQDLSSSNESENEPEGTASGDFTFTLASSGNSNTVHYFDTANSNVFKYNNESVYYQIQFTWKGSGKGNWYLYMRKVGGAIVKNGNDTYISKGTYTGAAFDKASKDVETGDVVLKNDGSDNGATITIGSDKSFTLKVGGTTDSSVAGAFVGDAK